MKCLNARTPDKLQRATITAVTREYLKYSGRTIERVGIPKPIATTPIQKTVAQTPVTRLDIAAIAVPP